MRLFREVMTINLIKSLAPLGFLTLTITVSVSLSENLALSDVIPSLNTDTQENGGVLSSDHSNVESLQHIVLPDGYLSQLTDSENTQHGAVVRSQTHTGLAVNKLNRVRRKADQKHSNSTRNQTASADNKETLVHNNSGTWNEVNSSTVLEKKPFNVSGKFTANRYRDVTSATICLSGVLFLLFGFILYSRMWTRRDQWLSMSVVMGEEESMEPPPKRLKFTLKELVDSKVKVVRTHFRKLQENGMVQSLSPKKNKSGTYKPLRQHSEDSPSASDEEKEEKEIYAI